MRFFQGRSSLQVLACQLISLTLVICAVAQGRAQDPIECELTPNPNTVPVDGGPVSFTVRIVNNTTDIYIVDFLEYDGFYDLLDPTSAPSPDGILQSNDCGGISTTIDPNGGEFVCSFTAVVDGGVPGEDIPQEVFAFVVPASPELPTEFECFAETIVTVEGSTPPPLPVRSPGFWKNHTELWFGLEEILIGDFNHNEEEDGTEQTILLTVENALKLLEGKPKQDKRTTLARSLVAAWLNIQVNNSNPSDDIVLAVELSIDWLLLNATDGNPCLDNIRVKGKQWTAEAEPLNFTLDEYNNSGEE